MWAKYLNQDMMDKEMTMEGREMTINNISCFSSLRGDVLTSTRQSGFGLAVLVILNLIQDLRSTVREILSRAQDDGRSIVSICLLLLTGCSGDQCIDADDFGFNKFTVSSRYDPSELFSQQQDNEVAPWLDSTYTVNGRPLMMVVKTWVYGVEQNNSGQLSAWCPWYGVVGDEGQLSTFCQRLITCVFVPSMCTNTKDAAIGNAPCILKNGVGLYALIADKGTDPNATFASQRFPAGLTVHLGEPPVGYSLYDIGQDGSIRLAGGISYQYQEPGQNANDLAVQYANAHLYFKILDKYYDDNNGQYKIIIKSGVNDSRPDPLQFLTNLVTGMLFGTSDNTATTYQNFTNNVNDSTPDPAAAATGTASSTNSDYGIVRNIYQNLTGNASYKLVVSVVLSLYIAVTALSFLSGNLNITQAELIVRIVKVIIISLLLRSEYSWSFFNDYLYFYFVDGMAQILALIQEAAQTGSGSSSILGLMIAPQTISKLISLLFVDWLGFIYIILYAIALYFVFLMIFEATIIYLTALIAIGMILVMGPIFLCFMLFQITRSLFENWLKQLISYAMQPLILFTGLAFISIIIRTEIYDSLGFRVCKFSFPNLGLISELFGSLASEVGLDPSITNSIFYWYFPSPMQGSDFSRTQAVIPVPMDHFVGPTGNQTFCPAYGCYENRYIELPYLDPVNDADRINNFFNGRFVQLDGLLLIFIAVYLLSKFNTMAVSISKFLSGSSGNLTALQNDGSYAGVEKQLNRPFAAVADRIDRQREKISALAAGAYENYKMGTLRKDALSGNANQSVIAEMERKHGMSWRDLKSNATQDYNDALTAKIEAVNPNADPKTKAQILADLSSKNFKDLPEGYRSDLRLKELAADARYAKEFQNVYADTHQNMSERGLGLLGKNIKTFRDFKEMDTRVKEQKKIRDAKRRQFAENLYSGYEGIKRQAVTALAGEKLRDRFEGNLTGAHYHDLQYNDSRLRTYAEELADHDRNIKLQELEAQINRETIKRQTDVLKPEYLAALEKADRPRYEIYSGLAREKLVGTIYNQLTDHDKPILMGDKFMREKATDMQSREIIDKLNNACRTIMDNDTYIAREDKYEVMQQKAANNIKAQYDAATGGHQRAGISQSEMITAIEHYYGGDPAQLRNLHNSIAEFNRNAEILAKIDERKALVDAEINRYIAETNSYRKASGMQEYKPTSNTRAQRS
jgi:type IV secretion system protein VirB6